jgi:hypothetical protein
MIAVVVLEGEEVNQMTKTQTFVAAFTLLWAVFMTAYLLANWELWTSVRGYLW